MAADLEQSLLIVPQMQECVRSRSDGTNFINFCRTDVERVLGLSLLRLWYSLHGGRQLMLKRKKE